MNRERWFFGQEFDSPHVHFGMGAPILVPQNGKKKMLLFLMFIVNVCMAIVYNRHMWYNHGLKEIGAHVSKLYSESYTVSSLCGERYVIGKLPKPEDEIWFNFIFVQIVLVVAGWLAVPIYELWKRIDKKFAEQHEMRLIINEHLPELDRDQNRMRLASECDELVKERQ